MNLTEQYPAEAAELTGRLFRENLHNCAEAVLGGVLQAAGQDCPLAVRRLASAFGRGMGGAGCACGALVGGQMAIGAFFGRASESGSVPEPCQEASRQLHNRFKKENGATCCRILHKGLPFGTDEQFSSCCERSRKAAKIAAQLIAETAAKLAKGGKNDETNN